MVEGTGSVVTERSDRPMCYTKRDWSREDEARRDHEREVHPVRHEEPEKKRPLTEKVKEMVGTR
jgi:hypothetical protein